MASSRSNKRRRKNRGRFGFLYKLFSFVIILMVVAAGCVVFFRVSDLVVSGESKYTREEIITASGIEIGDNLFLISRLGTARQILSKLPYVDEVSIRRALPDGVVLTVTECTPAALIEGNGSWWVIDSKGKILEKSEKPQRDGLASVAGITAILPSEGTVFAVEEAQDPKKDSLRQLLQALVDRGMESKVSSIDLTSPANIVFTYDGRFEVTVPMNADFTFKMRALDELVEKNLQPNEAGSIDLTRETKVYVNTKYGES